MSQKFLERNALWLSILIVFLGAAALYILGRTPICTCGYIKLWHGVTQSSENSQHLFDFYTFTHITHGLLFYALLYFLLPKLPPRVRFVIVLFVETIWEVFENTDFVINRYRAATISLDYYGDSIINSIGDILAMTVGFYMGYKLPVRYSVIATIVLELALLYFIRDSLALNMLMLVYPIRAVRMWQEAL